MSKENNGQIKNSDLVVARQIVEGILLACEKTLEMDESENPKATMINAITQNAMNTCKNLIDLHLFSGIWIDGKKQ